MNKLTCEKFVELIENDKKFHNCLDKVEEASGIELYETTVHKCYWLTFETILKLFFNENGLELIYWWLYEDVEKVIYDSNHNPIVTLNSAEDLYNYLINDVTPTYLNNNAE